MKQIPLSRMPAQTFSVVLGGADSASGQNCTISLYQRQDRMYLDLTVNSTQVCIGALCQNRANIVQSPSTDFKGALLFYDLEGDSPPNWEKLHTGTDGRWVLVYTEEDIFN